MAYQIIKYKLNVDGTVPSFIPKGVSHGLWLNPIEDSFGPCDNWLVGITDGKQALPNGQAELISTKIELKNYLDTFTSNWHYQAKPPLDPIEQGDAFNQEAESNSLWSELESLNS